MSKAAKAQPGKRIAILDAAEAMIRTVGYNGVSTRDVASAVGIKPASVHYYFPAKADLGVAVAERYTARFMDALGEPGQFHGRPVDAAMLYADVFRRALVDDGRLCLGAVLGAEIGGLPEEVAARTRIFFERNLEWLAAAFDAPDMPRGKAKSAAVLMLASLEGGVIVSNALCDPAILQRIAVRLAKAVLA